MGIILRCINRGFVVGNHQHKQISLKENTCFYHGSFLKAMRREGVV